MSVLRNSLSVVVLFVLLAVARAEKHKVKIHDGESHKAENKVDAAHSYPLFKQCDARWGNWVMGTNGQTICQVGCLMSSISMAINGWGIHIEGNNSNPGNLDIWLRNHGGFAAGTSELDESAVPRIAPNRIVWPSDGMHAHNDLSQATVHTYLTRAHPRVMIANVDNGGHFVLATGISGNTVSVNDPGFERNSYTWGDIVGWRIFDMS